MPDLAWIALRVDVPAEAADAVANFLFEAGAAGVLTSDAEGRGRTRLEASVPAGDETRVTAALDRYLASLATLAPGLAGATVETGPVAAIDWPAVARAHHRPQAIGRRLLVAPPWEVPADTGREVLVIEPGMAFGTGHHATTRGCLEAIEDVLARHPVGHALDVGTGSGILALALVRLGVPRVVACDVDAAALGVARTTLARNGAARVPLVAGGAGAFGTTFDLVVANLLADALVADAGVLAARVAPAGRLIVSGLLEPQVQAVTAAYPGWRCGAIHAADGWATLTLERRV